MRVTLDAAGRLVVPKPLRDALGLKPGQALEIRAGDGRLEIEIAPTPVRLRGGAAFMAELDLALERIEETPSAWPRYLAATRRGRCACEPARPP